MRSAILFLLVALVPVACANGRPKNSIPIRFGEKEHTLWVEIADEEAERQQGLMFRREMPKDAGMIFVFERPHKSSFWMKNTPLPLSIAFLDEDKRVLNIEKMQPYDDRHHTYAKGLALYAVEAHQGWFEERGIQPGDIVVFELPGSGKKE